MSSPAKANADRYAIWLLFELSLIRLTYFIIILTAPVVGILVNVRFPAYSVEVPDVVFFSYKVPQLLLLTGSLAVFRASRLATICRYNGR